MLSPTAWDLISEYARGISVFDLSQAQPGKRKRPATAEHKDFMCITSFDCPNVPVVQVPEMRLTSRHVPLLKRYIPAAVQPKLNAGHNRHLGEMRPVRACVHHTITDGLGLTAGMGPLFRSAGYGALCQLQERGAGH